MGIITDRRMKERRRKLLRRLLFAAIAAVLGAAAASQDLRHTVAAAADRVRTSAVFADTREPMQISLTLPEIPVYALQLAVFDSGERALAQARALQQEGIRCMVWQREKMRLIVSASARREGLNADASKGRDAYVYQETMPKVTLRLSADEKALEDVRTLLLMPDSVFNALDESEEALESIILRVRNAAERAQNAHPDNTLYTQLAQSLAGWCTVMDEALSQEPEETLRAYALTTMCALCRELRQALITSGG